MDLYVASSWRNDDYNGVLAVLKKAGYTCYDFRRPQDTYEGRVGPFGWSAIDPNWQSWDFATYRKHLLNHPTALQGFNLDFDAMFRADAGVLVQPAGPSAHIEAGFMIGRGKPVVSIGMPREPDLMLAVVDAVFCRSEVDLIDDWLKMTVRLAKEMDRRWHRRIFGKHGANPVGAEIPLGPSQPGNLQVPVPPPTQPEPIVDTLKRLLPYSTRRWRWANVIALDALVPDEPLVKGLGYDKAQWATQVSLSDDELLAVEGDGEEGIGDEGSGDEVEKE